MTPLRRWSLVALGTVLVAGVPIGVRALPPGDSDLSARQLYRLVAGSQDVGWSGYVVTDGALQLPAADDFSGLAEILGEHTRMRVWWRGERDWRVDRVLVSGENDLIHHGDRTTEWDYEDASATDSEDPDIRLPRTTDFLPNTLGARVLTDVDSAELTRLPVRRVAGIAAPGLRVEPASDKSSVDHVDLWADPETGVPLRVEVYGDGSVDADFTSAVRDFSGDTPPAARTAYEPSPGTEVSFDDVLDLADAANQYAPFLPPDTVAGLAKSSTSDGAVGVYGTGVTQLIAIPLRGREAGPLREQLGGTLGVVEVPVGRVVTAGPLGVLLSGSGDDGGWLVAGSVTAATLASAAEDLITKTVVIGDDR